MFGSLGGAEILFILVLALLIFGPRKLPQIGKSIGRAMGEFRRATYDLRSSLEQEVATEELRDTRAKLKQVEDDVAQAVREASPATIARGAFERPRDPAPAAADAVDAPSAPPAGPPQPTGGSAPSARPADSDDPDDRQS